MKADHEGFIRDFKELLYKYKCDITAANHYQAHCGESIRLTIEFSDMSEIELDTYFDCISEVSK